MNSKQAKQIPLQDYLSKLGFNPVRQERNLLVYYSPFRNEKTPSFKLNLKNNTFRDYGSGESGKIIQFNILLFSDSVSQALERIDKVYNYQKKIYIPQKIELQKNTQYEQEKIYTINKTKPLENIALLKYLDSRKINIKTAKKHLLEIYYSNNNKNYFALAFQNNSNGFEIRNKYFKGNLSKKNITTVNIKKDAPLFIFEGFIDFLSYLTYFDIISFEKLGSVIVLNSNSLKNIAVKEITKINPTKLIFVLDNDDSGNDTVKYLQEHLKIETQNHNSIYSSFNDFNDFLVHQKTKEITK